MLAGGRDIESNPKASDPLQENDTIPGELIGKFELRVTLVCSRGSSPDFSVTCGSIFHRRIEFFVFSSLSSESLLAGGLGVTLVGPRASMLVWLIPTCCSIFLVML